MEQEKQLAESLTKIASNCTLRMGEHSKVSTRLQKHYQLLTMTLIALPFVTAVFIMFGNAFVPLVAQVLSLLSIVLIRGMKFEERSKLHRLTMDSYNALHNSILDDLLLPEESRMRMTDLVKDAQNTYTKIQRKSPNPHTEWI
jgi:hypothetical protein